MINSEYQPQVEKNLEDLFDLPINPVEQGKAWGELSNHTEDNIDDLLINKLTVELIINQNKDE